MNVSTAMSTVIPDMNISIDMTTVIPDMNISIDMDTVVLPPYPPTWKVFTMHVVSISILVVNIPVFLLVPRRVPSLTCSMRYTMLSLALTDTLLGLLSLIRLIYFEANHNFYLPNDGFLCKLDSYLAHSLASVSISCLLCLSIDKLLTIKYLLRYTVIMTRQKVLGTAAGIWLLVFIVYLPCLLGKEAGFDDSAYVCHIVPQGAVHFIGLVTLFQILPTVGIATSFILIWQSVYKARHFRRQSLRAGHHETTADTKDKSAAMKTVKTLLIMSAGFYLMWLPYFILIAYWKLFNGKSFSPLSDFLTRWLGVANSLLNPIIYIPTLTSYRHALMNLLRIKPSAAPSGVRPSHSKSDEHTVSSQVKSSSGPGDNTSGSPIDVNTAECSQQWVQLQEVS